MGETFYTLSHCISRELVSVVAVVLLVKGITIDADGLGSCAICRIELSLPDVVVCL